MLVCYKQLLPAVCRSRGPPAAARALLLQVQGQPCLQSCPACCICSAFLLAVKHATTAAACCRATPPP